MVETIPSDSHPVGYCLSLLSGCRMALNWLKTKMRASLWSTLIHNSLHKSFYKPFVLPYFNVWNIRILQYTFLSYKTKLFPFFFNMLILLSPFTDLLLLHLLHLEQPPCWPGSPTYLLLSMAVLGQGMHCPSASWAGRNVPNSMSETALGLHKQLLLSQGTFRNAPFVFYNFTLHSNVICERPCPCVKIIQSE